MDKSYYPNIKETNLQFTGLSKRSYTDLIVIHHTGSVKDIDASAAQIHDWHQSQGWAGIGYHYVVRKDGTIERGRPEWAIGAHAGENGMNSHSIGIHLSGDFNAAYPTAKQVDSTAMLIAYICEKYNITADRQHVKGHREVGSTDCPGKNLFSILETLTGKANFYRYNNPNETVAEVKEVDTSVTDNSEGFPADINKIAILARKYESNGDPACIADNPGDLGGVSYGLYQFASKVEGVVEGFVDWLCKYSDDKLANYGRVLKAAYPINSEGFKQTWYTLGTIDPGHFGELQDEYVKSKFYDLAAKKLAAEGYNVNKHSNAIKAVVFSRAVQNGPTGCAKLFAKACTKPNLSYVDDKYFDKEMINAIYNFLIEECENISRDDNGVYRSANDFCHGSLHIIEALHNRFVNERKDALDILKED